MEYMKLGNTDITISKLCVGCMSFGKAGTLHDWIDELYKPHRVVGAILKNPPQGTFIVDKK